MLTPGVQCGLTREEAMEILEELQRCRCYGRRLLAALREVQAIADEALGSLTPDPSRST